jgi:hypothetical protein
LSDEVRKGIFMLISAEEVNLMHINLNKHKLGLSSGYAVLGSTPQV